MFENNKHKMKVKFKSYKSINIKYQKTKNIFSNKIIRNYLPPDIVVLCI